MALLNGVEEAILHNDTDAKDRSKSSHPWNGRYHSDAIPLLSSSIRQA